MRAVRGGAGAIGLAVALSALLFLALSARFSQPPTSVGAIGSPQAAPTDPPLPSTLPSPPELGLACGEYVLEVLRNTNDVAGLSALADAVVTGKVVAVGEAQWATAGGKAPANELGLSLDARHVYRVVEVEVTGVGKQAAGKDTAEVGASIRVRVLGGTIGCRTFRSSDELSFEVRSEVVLFLSAAGQPTLAAAPAMDFDVIDVWPIKGGVVSGRDVPMSPDELLSIAAAE